MVEEEEKETIIKLATPDKGSVMPPANYKIGVLAQPHQYQKGAAETVGETVGSKVGETALVGGGPKGTFFEKGLWGKMQPGFSKFFGGASAPYAATGMQTMGMAPGQLLAMGSNPALAGTVSASGAAAAPGMMAGLASNPLGWAVLGGLALRKLFRNKGGAVGPLSPQYKQGGGEMPDYDNDPLWVEWLHLYDDMNSGIIEPSHPRLVELETILQQKYPYPYTYKQGGNVQHKEHGGMTGPLSNSKSVKMEKKETIEFKN